MFLPKLWMVFDVESIGLHGEGFAVGYVVVNSDGKEIESAVFSCKPSLAIGSDEGRKWVSENCPIIEANCSNVNTVRTMFWAKWEKFKKDGALLAAECAWPVEARFLLDCMKVTPGVGDFDGPYPLVDVSSVMLASNMNPMGTYIRKEDELPNHNPLADARQSARLLLAALANNK